MWGGGAATVGRLACIPVNIFSEIVQETMPFFSFFTTLDKTGSTQVDSPVFPAGPHFLNSVGKGQQRDMFRQLNICLAFGTVYTVLPF